MNRVVTALLIAAIAAAGCGKSGGAAPAADFTYEVADEGVTGSNANG